MQGIGTLSISYINVNMCAYVTAVQVHRSTASFVRKQIRAQKKKKE